MKVAIVIDQLIERDYSSLVLESFLSLLENEEVTLFTLAHKPGGILGPIAQHQTQSSFLSQFILDNTSFEKAYFKKMLAVGSLKISSDFDFILVLSSGWSDLIRLPKGPKKVVLKLTVKVKNRLQQYLQKKNKNHFDQKYSFIKKDGFDYIAPFHQVEEVRFDNKDLKAVSIFTDKDSQLDAKIESLLKKYKLPLIWIGKEGTNNLTSTYLASPCSSEVSSALNQSLFSIDLTSGVEPNYLLSLSAGRPILLSNDQESLREVSEGMVFVDFNDVNAINQKIDHTLTKLKQFDGHQMHLLAAKCNARKFKRELWSRIFG